MQRCDVHYRLHYKWHTFVCICYPCVPKLWLQHWLCCCDGWVFSSVYKAYIVQISLVLALPSVLCSVSSSHVCGTSTILILHFMKSCAWDGDSHGRLQIPSQSGTRASGPGILVVYFMVEDKDFSSLNFSDHVTLNVWNALKPPQTKHSLYLGSRLFPEPVIVWFYYFLKIPAAFELCFTLPAIFLGLN